MTENFEKGNTPKNVLQFLEKSARAVGAYERDSFFGHVHCEMTDCESPIEQLFLTAIYTLATINDVRPHNFAIRKDLWVDTGVHIVLQHKIGKYRVDFVLRYCGDAAIVDAKHLQTISDKEERTIVVELDGHKFHDKDEPQRQYEKKRDRFLQKQGYKVFHFTGTEIFKNPFAAAAECLAYLTETPLDEIEIPKV